MAGYSEGYTFTTKYAKLLKVMGFIRVAHGRKKYILECGICSKDIELWPYGSIMSIASGVKYYKTPCGCGHNPNWTSDQQKIRVTRYCNENNIEVISWWDTYIGNKSKVVLKHAQVTKGMAVNNLFSKGFQSSSKRNYKEQAELFTSSGKYHHGCVFTKSDEISSNGIKSYWLYTCPFCSNDKYTKAGLCNGIFRIQHSSAMLGYSACRCSPSYRKTPEQREFAIVELCNKEGLTFFGWVSTNKNTMSKFTYLCTCGFIVSVTYKNFMRGDRCSACCKTGYSKTKQACFYIVRWYGFVEEFIKFGITNNTVESRVKLQSGKASLDYEILHIFSDSDGEVAFNCEKEVKATYKNSKKCPRDWLPDGFTETTPYSEEYLAGILSIANKPFK